MAEVDLHLHTTHSDGRLTPAQLVRLCAARGLRVISISDHDSTEGIPEALEAALEFPQLTVITGVELSTDVPGSEIHMLGYFVDYQNSEFQRALRGFRDGREGRACEIVEKLATLGIEVSWERVRQLSGGGAIGRPHIAEAMVEGGYVRYPRDAFDQYLGREGMAYVGRVKLTPSEAIRILVDCGALPVMAHPTYSAVKSDRDEVDALRETLGWLKGEGLVGMEVYYGDYTAEQVDRLAALADELGLVPCGGSDYHASGNPGEPEPGTVGPSMETVEALMSIRKQSAATSCSGP